MGDVCQTTFRVPEDIEQIISLLNGQYKGCVSVVDSEGCVLGDYACDLDVQFEPTNYVWVYTGDQLMFKADTVSEARAFLQGILIAVKYWNDPA